MNTQLYMVRENEDLPTRAMDGASVGDRALTGQVLNALYTLQEALDAAVLAGLIAVPQVKPAQGRFNELGSDAESHVLGVEIYRKLA